jgi:hypothetical protein
MKNKFSLLSSPSASLLAGESVDLFDLILHLSPHLYKETLHLAELALNLIHGTVYLLSNLVAQDTLAVALIVGL